jgi:hypothetical protein
MGFGNYLKQALLSHAFGISAMTPPAELYVALMSVEPADDNTGGTELTGTGYARVACGAWAYDAALHGVKNVVDILFPVIGANDWTVANAGAVFDASTGGDLMGHAALSPVIAGSLGEQVKIPAGALVVQFNP